MKFSPGLQARHACTPFEYASTSKVNGELGLHSIFVSPPTAQPPLSQLRQCEFVRRRALPVLQWYSSQISLQGGPQGVPPDTPLVTLAVPIQEWAGRRSARCGLRRVLIPATQVHRVSCRGHTNALRLGRRGVHIRVGRRPKKDALDRLAVRREGAEVPTAAAGPHGEHGQCTDRQHLLRRQAHANVTHRMSSRIRKGASLGD
jgi:hypothetical protein